ncbi:MAG: ABC transporter ATP-binding protein/permease, partial [Bacteroidales bacterium]|nr:ABC transporter ATP-binding protein/permease [Bacteroidales bacterium]
MNNNFKRVIQYMLPYRLYILKAFCCNILYAFFSLLTLGMIVPFISILFGLIEPVTVLPAFSLSTDALVDTLSYYITSLNNKYGVFEALMFVSVVFVFCSLLSNLFHFLGMYYLTPVNANATRDIRNDLFHKILILPVSFFTKHKAGDIITRFNTDLHEIDTALIRCTIDVLFRQPLVIILFMGTLCLISPLLTISSLLIFPLMSFITKKISKAIRRKALQMQTELGNVSSMYEESISGLRIIKGLSAQPYFLSKFKQINGRFARYSTKIVRYLELSAPLSELLTLMGLLAILLIGAILLIENESMQADSLILFVLVFARLIPPIQTSIRGYGYIQKGLVSANRVFEVLDSDEQIIESVNAVPVKSFDNSIVFNNVSFAYESEPVLHNICLEIKKGETVALVGNSGGGKSTLINLLLRFYDIEQGEIKIDNHNIKDCVISDIRMLFGVITQDVLLFNDTVFNNICFGKANADKSAVMEAAKNAGAYDFIMEMPNQYDTVIGDRGAKLSGGQRQRLSIARALVQDPAILLLDEATSALDSHSEQIVQQALDFLMKNRTSIIIAHRLSTIQNADRI